MSRATLMLQTVTVAALLTISAAACAATEPATYAENGDNKPSGLAMAADLVIGRPLGLVATVLGTGLFVVGLPFEAISGDISTPAHRLIVDPALFTFSRPLGESK